MREIKGLLFGTAGNPLSSRQNTTPDGIERVAELGLRCMEVQFVQGVKMGEASARTVGKVSLERGVILTAHAPYFINLNAHETAKIRASQERLLHSARIAAVFNARGVVFHPAFYLGDSPSEVYGRVRQYLYEVVELLRREGNNTLLRPEVTGKISQFGTLSEVLSLSADIEGVAPCIDFAHLYARTGELNSYPEFFSILTQIERKLGRVALDNMHVHVSGIARGRGGETKHLVLRESAFQYMDLLKALKEFDTKGVVICESPNREDDALFLQQTYHEL